MARHRGHAVPLVLVLLAALVAPFAGGGARACDSHLCRCAGTHCAPKRAVDQPCHGAPGATVRCAMRGTCQHDTPSVAGLPPYLLPQRAPLARAVRVESAIGLPTPRARDGFPRLDSRPPWTA